MDIKRRGLIGGVVAGAAVIAGRAVAQTTAPDVNQAASPAAAQTTVSSAAPPLPNENWPNLRRYAASNAEVAAWSPEKRKVVLMGDSITDNWASYTGTFFADNGWVGRGISGQVSAQMLVRFMAEVVALRPKIVHIMAGTNDIAGNKDPYDPQATVNNLTAMASLAKSNGIKVVMASVPPALSFGWRLQLGNPHDRIVALNAWVKGFCAAQHHTYLDYWPVLATPEGGLKTELANDSVHPNKAGYAVMAPVAQAAFARFLT